jgi:hypothetical protein
MQTLFFLSLEALKRKIHIYINLSALPVKVANLLFESLVSTIQLSNNLLRLLLSQNLRLTEIKCMSITSPCIDLKIVGEFHELRHLQLSGPNTVLKNVTSFFTKKRCFDTLILVICFYSVIN